MLPVRIPIAAMCVPVTLDTLEMDSTALVCKHYTHIHTRTHTHTHTRTRTHAHAHEHAHEHAHAHTYYMYICTGIVNKLECILPLQILMSVNYIQHRATRVVLALTLMEALSALVLMATVEMDSTVPVSHE